MIIWTSLSSQNGREKYGFLGKLTNKMTHFISVLSAPLKGYEIKSNNKSFENLLF